MELDTFHYHRPTTLEEAQLRLAELGDEASLYAGGTELVLLMKLGLSAPEHLIDLKHISSLSRLEAEDGSLLIGATATHSRLSTEPHVSAAAPVLARMFAALANPRVRHAGTLGGNLAFGDPQSDPATVLLAMDASVELSSLRGSRSVGLAAFGTGAYETVREDDEILTGVRVPTPSAGTVVCYERLVMHHERPIANAALSVRPDGTGVLVIGALTARPVRHEEAGTVFATAQEVVWRDYARELADATELLPVTETLAYARNLVAVMVIRIFRAADRELTGGRAARVVT
jgi:carbon-monoxide dehydrogenase medium subunit